VKRALVLRASLWSALAALVGAVLWAKSSYETGWPPLLKGGLLGAAISVVVVLAVAKFAALRRRQQ
jgi:polyferredoxin